MEPDTIPDNTIFVFGGWYKRHDRDPGRFHLVTPSRTNRPYVYTEEEVARRMFRLTQHHSSLYRCHLGKGTLELVQRGELREQDPVDHVLSNLEAALIASCLVTIVEAPNRGGQTSDV